jgi:hypothetical protein
MTQMHLFLLLSLDPEDLKWHEAWGEAWEWLLAEGLIEFADPKSEIPTLTAKGQRTIDHAVRSAAEFLNA